MVKVFCDKCGKEAYIAYAIHTQMISHPKPSNIRDFDVSITDNDAKISYVLCQSCYRKLGLPNIYTTLRTNSVSFRDEEEDDKIKSFSGQSPQAIKVCGL